MMLTIPSEPGVVDWLALEYDHEVKGDEEARCESHRGVSGETKLLGLEDPQIEEDDRNLGQAQRCQVEQFVNVVKLYFLAVSQAV